MMFKTTAPEPLPVKVVEVPAAADFVPLSHLSLDLDEPPIGWLAYLNNVGVEILTDDVGRKAIHRHDARRLFDEHREAEAHAREVMERREQQFIQQDQLLRASLPTGFSAGMVPDGMTGAEAMVLAGEKRRPRSVREQLLERELAHTGPELIYQSIGPDEG
jgi:hypothetical protein